MKYSSQGRDHENALFMEFECGSFLSDGMIVSSVYYTDVKSPVKGPEASSVESKGTVVSLFL